MSQTQAAHDLAATGLKVAPAVAVMGADTVLGITLQDWVFIATLLYLFLQAVVIMPKVSGVIKGWFKRGV